MKMRMLLFVVPALVGAVALAACGASDEGVSTGDDTGEPDGTGGPDDRDGLEGDYLATEVTDDGQPRTLVEGTQISLGLHDGDLSVHAGCNEAGGRYRIEDGVLRVDELMATLIGCDPALDAQDVFVADLLSAGPTVEVIEGGFVLRSDTASITFVDRSVVEPDVELQSTAWVVDTFFEDVGPDGTSSARVGPMGTFTFGADGVVTGSDGCNDFGGLEYEVSGDTIAFDVASEVSTTDVACPQLDTEPFWTVFSAISVEFSIEGDRLTLSTGTQGLRATAAGS